MEIRNQWYVNKNRPTLACPKEQAAKQSFKEECDINNILKKYEKTGVLPDMIRNNPQYGDFSNVGTYQDAFMVVQKAHEQFNALDARVRDRFQNDPAQFLEFTSDARNLPEMEKLGMAIPKSPKAVEEAVKTESGEVKK